MRTFLLVLTAVSLVVSASAEPIRTALTLENQFPRTYHGEVGIQVEYGDYALGNEKSSYAAELRYGLAENFAVVASVPYVDFTRFDGQSASGVGDIQAGMQLRVWEDIFRYPYVLIQGNYFMDTGDQADGTGAGESIVEAGVTVGTTVNDVWDYTAEARYRFPEDSDNYAIVAGTIGYNLSEQVLLLGEIQWTEQAGYTTSKDPILLLGGVFYQINETVSFSLHGGGETGSQRDVVVNSRLTVGF